jgi:hypothetical protein
MSNIQVFQDAFAVSFPVEVAEQVLSRIEMIYGAEFQKNYGHLSDQELTDLACTVLNGLTPAELYRGIARMNTEKWCPKLPEFRSWCLSTSDWWTAEMAWAKAMQFEADNSVKITKLAKVALDEVRHILDNENQRSAHFAFKDIYQNYLEKAKKQGKEQEFHVVKKVAQLGNSERNRKGVPCPPHLMNQIRSVGKRGVV